VGNGGAALPGTSVSAQTDRTGQALPVLRTTGQEDRAHADMHLQRRDECGLDDGAAAGIVDTAGESGRECGP
jgi:hypothetical protein